jgi:hypothetical protein
MPKIEYKYIVVDKVEDSEINGKPAKVAIDKEGIAWHFDESTRQKWGIIVQNARLQLLMDGTIVKSFATVHEALKDKYPPDKSKPKQSSTSESIEAQVSIKSITDLLVHDKEVDEDILESFWAWHRKVLKNGGN